MGAYILRRLALMIPTLLGIMALNFFVIQAVPGGPVDQLLAEIDGTAVSAVARISGEGQEVAVSGEDASRGARGLDPEFVEELRAQFGFDKPTHERFWDMLVAYATFDFGDSFFRDASVVDLVLEKMPVSISLGLWSTLIIYMVSIPLGVTKAVRDGTKFDVYSSGAVIAGYAIPGFLFAVLLIVVFAGGRYLDWFPLRGLTSDDWDTLSWPMRIVDYCHQLALPLTALVIGGFAGLTMLTKNAFVDEIGKQYVLTARAKGLSEQRVLYGHVFRNAMLIVIAGFPATLIGLFCAGSLLIEVIFSLDGLGQLGFEAIVNRDYPVVFGTLYVFSLMGLVVGLISDLTYTLVDPRIDFESRSA